MQATADPALPPTALTVQIVSYNTRDLLDRCLTDLRAQERVDVHTIVVDNASTDGSAELVAKKFPEVELV